jgi:hypothetical protein
VGGFVYLTCFHFSRWTVGLDIPNSMRKNAGMALGEILSILGQAHDGCHLVRVRAVKSSGNTVDIVGYVTAIREDGGIRVSSGDPLRGDVHDFPPRGILGVERVHGA